MTERDRHDAEIATREAASLFAILAHVRDDESRSKVTTKLRELLRRALRTVEPVRARGPRRKK